MDTRGVASPLPGRGARPGYSRESLLAVAVEVFNERGYDGTSMEDLSKRLGIGKASIYHHVASKEDLLGLALDRALDGWSGLIASSSRSRPAPAVDRLEELVRGMVGVIVDELPYVTLLLRVRGNTETERKALMRRRRFERSVAALVEEAAAEGNVRRDIAPIVLARLLCGTVNSTADWFRASSRRSAEEFAAHVSAVVFEGVLGARVAGSARRGR